MTSTISPDQYVSRKAGNISFDAETYVLRFGKYKNLLAKDIAKITEVNKYGKKVPAGLNYLKFLVEKAEWFRHREIIEEIMKRFDKEEEPVQKETKTDSKKV